MWAISTDTSGNPITANELKNWLRSQPNHPFPFPMLLDPTMMEIGFKYAFGAGTPMTIWVDRQMVIRFQEAGFYPLRFLLYQVEHGINFPRMGIDFAMIRDPFFGDDLFFLDD